MYSFVAMTVSFVHVCVIVVSISITVTIANMFIFACKFVSEGKHCHIGIVHY